MFDGNIIEQYVNNRQDTDTLTACRAIVKQCFDKYGGTGYENFYYPYSGLFKSNGSSSWNAGDWFALYDYTGAKTSGYVSPCANQLTNVAACNDSEIIRQAFGGFDRMYTSKTTASDDNIDQLAFDYQKSGKIDGNDETGNVVRYGLLTGHTDGSKPSDTDNPKMKNRMLRPVGVATEVYNQIIDTLSIQCININGRFVERQFIKENIYGGKNNADNICLWYPKEPADNADSNTQKNYNDLTTLGKLYGIFKATQSGTGEDVNIPPDFTGEDMCPRDYNINVDTRFWGACLCWENGGRRSKNGKNATCVAELPVNPAEPQNTGDAVQPVMDKMCYSVNEEHEGKYDYTKSDSQSAAYNNWCTQYTNSNGQVCPYGYFQQENTDTNEITCESGNSTEDEESKEAEKSALQLLPETVK
jgi:hypothetical protein